MLMSCLDLGPLLNEAFVLIFMLAFGIDRSHSCEQCFDAWIVQERMIPKEEGNIFE